MTLNFDKIKKRHEDANKPKEERSDKPKINLEKWGPMALTEKGETKEFILRLVCTEDGDPLKLFHFHYDVGNQSVLCPKRNFAEKCPVCEYASHLWKQGTDDSQAAAKKLFAKERYVAPVIVRNHMEYEDADGNKQQHGVRWYGMGVTSYKIILDKMMDSNYNGGDITDPDQGYDFKLKFTRPTKKSAYPSSDLEVLPFGERFLAPSKDGKKSNVKEVARLLKSIPEIGKVFERKSPQEVQDMLDQFLAKPTDDVGDQKYGVSDGNDDTVNSVDEAVAELKKANDGKVSS